MAQLQGLSQGVMGKQQAITLPVLVVAMGGWETKGWNGKGTGFLTLDNSAGFFTEARSPSEARGCCKLSFWNISLSVTGSWPPLFQKGGKQSGEILHSLRVYTGRVRLISSLKSSWFIRPRNQVMLTRGTMYFSTWMSCEGDNYAINCTAIWETDLCCKISPVIHHKKKTYLGHPNM